MMLFASGTYLLVALILGRASYVLTRRWGLNAVGRGWAELPTIGMLPTMVADVEARWAANASPSFTHVEAREGGAVMGDAGGQYHVGERDIDDLAAAASARRARALSLVGAVVGAVILTAHAGPARAQSTDPVMTPPNCETYERKRPHGGPFEQLSDLFSLSIYRWEEADFGRYRDFLLVCGGRLPSLRGNVPAEAWGAAVARGVAELKEYAGYGQGRPRTKLDPDTPDYTPTFLKMSCDRFTRATIESWAGNGTPGKIEGSPFTVPVAYWNDEVWQSLENRLLECEQQRQSPHATRTKVRLLVGAQRERYHWEIDRAQEPERNRKMIAWAQEGQQKEAEALDKFRREEQARLASDSCNQVEVRRQMMSAANAMLQTRYGARTLIDLTNGRTSGLEPAPGRSCIFTVDWSSGQRGVVVITQRKNSFGDDLIEVRPFER
ncbi:hypothetical protein [Methylobacterium radiodurans]|uniref:hypothetical protein n=1 Tax=Methylobacterium radiodurans TaxID=2202828 RepID=UPI001FE64BC2|nr:hypothetical protein [Methylobacterium radiodurans]